jgi:hypothetical protein
VRKHRRKLLVALAAAAVAAGLVFLTFRRNDAGAMVSRGRIVEGMTEAEADGIQGPAPDISYPEDYGLPMPQVHCVKTWDACNAVADHFDADGRVLGVTYATDRSSWPDETSWRIKRWLGW